VRVTGADVARLAAHLAMAEAAFRSRYLAASGDRLADGLGHRCVFLEDGPHTRCSVYPARPERCRSWPFWDEHRDPVALAEAARVCPGIRLRSGEGGIAARPGDPIAPARKRSGSDRFT